MSLNDVLQIQRNRRDRANKIFYKIFERVKIRINHTAKYGGTHCYYDVPQLLYGLPSVDLGKCADFIEKKLREEGFVVYRLSNTNFLISWEESAIEEQVKERKRRKNEKKEKLKMEKIEDERREDLMSYLINNN